MLFAPTQAAAIAIANRAASFAEVLGVPMASHGSPS
jgi:hypothetical protein